MRQKNMTRITTIHHSLGKIDSSAGNVRSFIDILYVGDRPAVDPHSHAKVRVIFQRLADLQCTADRRLRIIAKNERTTVAGRQTQ